MRWSGLRHAVMEAGRLFSKQNEDRYCTVNLVEYQDRWLPMSKAVQLAGAEWCDVKELFLTARHSLAKIGWKPVSLRWWSLGRLQWGWRGQDDIQSVRMAVKCVSATKSR
eukprot:1181494-Prorocentrum_minimum.AAC.4